MKTIAIVQARMGSERLYGKVLKTVLDKPLLQWELERVKNSRALSHLILATTTLPEDNSIARLAGTLEIPVFKGSVDNVFSRYLEAASLYNPDLVVRITGDCPLIDPEILDRVIHEALKTGADYTSNTLKLTYPRGMDVEVFKMSCFKEIAKESLDPWEKEHVTPFFYRHPERFNLHNVPLDPPRADLRLTVDTREDFELIEKILKAFGGKPFSLRDIIALIDKHPEWKEINAHVRQKTDSPNR